ncbi:hypothetical protein LXA43DRAFT_1002834 [Ganoderma leucocontextum]|nr:hypothetical protein LXA43DRAFT_1002834 [Ganoderma leucocontextum]
MEGQLRSKVTVRVDRPRPASPFKSPTTSLSPPLIRPKAKVNTSATIQTRKPATVVSTAPSVRNSTNPAPNRAPSPFKPPNGRGPNTPPVTVQPARSRLTARTNGNNSTSPLPESRRRPFIAANPTPSSFARPRRGSTSSSAILSSPVHTEISFGSSPARSVLALPSQSDENTPASSPSNLGVRVKAKVTRVAAHGHSVHSPPSLPASPQLANRPARVPSISNLSLSPPLMPSNSGAYSPSSTASSPLPHHTRFGSARDADAHSARFGSTRETKHHSFQPLPKAFQSFVHNDDTAIDYGARGPLKGTAKVGPETVPLPPQSPPTSAVSFSSRSSASRSSASYDTHDSKISRSTAPTPNSHVNGNGHVRQASKSSQPRRSVDGFGIRSEPMSREPSMSEMEFSDDDTDAHHQDGDSEDEERKMKAAAKSNRKIADLEITNRSLLAINTTLEATKNRQAKEIRDLRRKLRESRLILPPPAYRAVKSSLSPEDLANEEDDDDEEEEEEEEEEDGSGVLGDKADEAYRRVRSIIDTLLKSGRAALESRPQDFVGTGKGGAKVLTAEEVRTWRGDDDLTETRSNFGADADSIFASSRPLTPSRVAVPDSDDGLGSEDEVEASLIEPDTPPPLPPITITPSEST